MWHNFYLFKLKLHTILVLSSTVDIKINVTLENLKKNIYKLILPADTKGGSGSYQDVLEVKLYSAPSRALTSHHWPRTVFGHSRRLLLRRQDTLKSGLEEDTSGHFSSFSTRPVSLRGFILNALPSCLPISNNHSICASLRNCLMWILRWPILGLDYYSPFSPWSFPIQFITKKVWLCRTQFHLHSLSQWFLTLAPLNFFLIEHQSPKWEQLRFSIQRRSKSKRRTWNIIWT